MSVQLDNGAILLIGDCPVEDAEPLLVALQEDPRRVVDITRAGRLHTAPMQVLLALRPQVVGKFADGFQSRWLAPLLSCTTPG